MLKEKKTDEASTKVTYFKYFLGANYVFVCIFLETNLMPTKNKVYVVVGAIGLEINFTLETN